MFIYTWFQQGVKIYSVQVWWTNCLLSACHQKLDGLSASTDNYPSTVPSAIQKNPQSSPTTQFQLSSILRLSSTSDEKKNRLKFNVKSVAAAILLFCELFLILQKFNFHLKVHGGRGDFHSSHTLPLFVPSEDERGTGGIP